MTDYILQMKETWPTTFKVVSRNFLEDLQMGLDVEFLCEESRNMRSRKISQIINNLRSRSSSRDRRASPLRPRNTRGDKWSLNVNLCELLIDQLMDNIECNCVNEYL